MWGKPPFSISDDSAVDVRNLAAAREWYKEMLGLSESKAPREDDSGRPFVDLCISKNGPFISLIELAEGIEPKRGHTIFFARNLEKAHEWLAERGVVVEAITADSGGNRLFRFQDLDGNKIEVCVEP